MDWMMSLLRAFAVGGLFCVLAQILIDKTGLTPARILVSYVVIGVFLGAIGVYEPLLRFAGAGASVPLTGFGNLIATGVRNEVAERGLLGALTGPLSAAAAGTSAALCFSFLAALIFRGRPK